MMMMMMMMMMEKGKNRDTSILGNISRQYGQESVTKKRKC